jgi:hypothetical protein
MEWKLDCRTQSRGCEGGERLVLLKDEFLGKRVRMRVRQ